MFRENEIKKIDASKDVWYSLRSFTQARIALGRMGISVPLNESLQFKMAHAHARDAVFSTLDEDLLIDALEKIEQPYFVLHSKANDRNEYLHRPDLGRRLSNHSLERLSTSYRPRRPGYARTPGGRGFPGV